MTQGQKAQATRERIARKARAAFRATGSDTTRQAIAAAANVSRALVIARFPTMDTLARAAYAEELAALERVATESLDIATPGSAQSILSNFVQQMSETFAGRPVLAKAFLPYETDPWQPKTQKQPETEGLTFDDLIRVLRTLLKEHWDVIGESYTPQGVSEDAKLFVHAMLSGAANKLTASAIADPVLRAVL